MMMRQPDAHNAQLEKFAAKKWQEHLDKLLVKELNQMTTNERDKIYEEIHGVNKVQEESPALVNVSLFSMDQALQRINPRPAYNQAFAQNPTYCLNPKLRLAFLRAEYFDAHRAAVRFVKFFEGKLEYFGPDALARDLRLTDDMDDEDRKCLHGGHLQILPARDRAGRAIFCDFQAAFPKCYKEVKNLVKCSIYLMLCAAEDEENQKLGMVGLLYHVGKQLSSPDPDLMARGASTLQWVPIRFNSIHICVNHTMSSIVGTLLLIGAGREIRARSRVHHGWHTECQYSLMTFGVPVKVFPISDNGELKLADFHKWIKKRSKKDTVLRQGRPFLVVDLPSSKDILLGRGKPCQTHPGNDALRYLCERRIGEYNATPKGEKPVIASAVVRTCGRFLKRESDGWWTEASHDVATDKVIKIFLSIRAMEKNVTRNPKASAVLSSAQAPALDTTERDSKRARCCGIDGDSILCNERNNSNI